MIIEDDCGIEFSKFQIQVKILPLRRAEKLAHFAATYLQLSHYITERLSQIGAPIILVKDVQIKLAAYNGA